jgi:hypothetical protein
MKKILPKYQKMKKKYIKIIPQKTSIYPNPEILKKIDIKTDKEAEAETGLLAIIIRLMNLTIHLFLFLKTINQKTEKRILSMINIMIQDPKLNKTKKILQENIENEDFKRIY